MNAKSIPTVLSADEILEKAFKRADKFQIWNAGNRKKTRAESGSKLNSFGHTISSKLRMYVRKFPSMDQLHPFYYSLIDLKIDNDKLRHSLGALQWAANTTDAVLKENERKLKGAEGKKDMEKVRKGAYGRISSIVRKVEKDLVLLQETREFMKTLPEIDVDEPVTVIAGAPNVGKSAVMTRLTAATPKIASYPFTTQNISIGHMDLEGERFQIMDTPGLLDRPLEERNDIERHAILAIEHIASVIVFILDPSESCGYVMEEQKNLRATIMKSFPEARFITITNKSDMATMDEHMAVSALYDKGFDELEKLLYKELDAIPPAPYYGPD